MRSIRTAALLAILLLIPILALADTTGSVRGYVTSAPYPGPAYTKSLLKRAVVTFSGPAGVFAAHADRNGFYVIFGLPPGKYAIDAEVPDFGFRLVPGIQHVCIHAGENLYRNLAIGLTDLPILYVLEEIDYRRQFRPDASQTADVYSIGDC